MYSKVWTFDYVSKLLKDGLAPVAHAYNPSYSGSRDRKITIQSQPRANISQNCI
jgi:hypothetical protein